MRHALPFLSALLISSTAMAGPFSAVMAVTRDTWPDRQHLGVICDYRMSQAQVQALAEAAGAEARITVIDIRHADQVNPAAARLKDRKAQFLVLMPGDRLTGDGTHGASRLVRSLAFNGLPCVGTTRAALRQGAVFSVGEGTGNVLLVGSRPIGTIDVILPKHLSLSSQAGLANASRSMARLEVLSAE